LGKAAFDERLSLLGLLLSKLREGFYQAYLMDETVTELYETMKSLKIRSQEAGVSVAHELELAAGRKRSLMEMQKDAGQLSKDEICIRHQLIKTLEEMWKYLLESEDSFENAKERFVELTGKREMQIEDAANQLEHAFRFLEDAFGESQEMVIFVTELTSGYYSMKFISEHGSDKYYQYNKSLLFREREQELYDEIHEVKKLLE
ncbi:MAG: ATPase, partial [Clostridium sp.]|nr:ATPase [Clostridium sp.]